MPNQNVNLSRPQNLILASLPDEDYQRLAPYFTEVYFKKGQTIHDAEDLSASVLFLNQGVASLSISNSDGVTLEMSMVGTEGTIGERAIFKHGSFIIRCRMLTDGHAYKLPSRIFEAEFYRFGRLHDLILNRLETRIMETSQTSLCNHIHPIKTRLVRWLLTLADRARSEKLFITQETIADSLSCHRPIITQLAKRLRDKGLIAYSRGNISITNREGMEKEVCECYFVIKEMIEKLYNLNWKESKSIFLNSVLACPKQK